MLRMVVVVIFTLAPIFYSLTARAMSHSISTDLVRQVDQNRDGGMFNFYWQGSLSKREAVRAGYSSGDELSIIEISYKNYLDRYHQGVFFEAGGAFWDGKDDSSVGVMGAIGYERTLANHFVAGGAVKMHMGVDEDVAGVEETPFFEPSFFFLYAF